MPHCYVRHDSDPFLRDCSSSRVHQKICVCMSVCVCVRVCVSVSARARARARTHAREGTRESEHVVRAVCIYGMTHHMNVPCLIEIWDKT